MLGLWGPCPCLPGTPRPGQSGDVSPHVLPRSARAAGLPAPQRSLHLC